MTEQAPDDHEHLFPEEQEPTGRLVLAPCLTCGLSALDGMAAVKAERAALDTDAAVQFRTSMDFANIIRDTWRAIGVEDEQTMTGGSLPEAVAAVVRASGAGVTESVCDPWAACPAHGDQHWREQDQRSRQDAAERVASYIRRTGDTSPWPELDTFTTSEAPDRSPVASGAGLGGTTEQSCAQFEWGTCSCPRECPDPAPDDTADPVARLRGDRLAALLEQRTATIVEQDWQIDDLIAERDAAWADLTALREVLTGKVRHVYAGLCPDDTEGWDSRDPDCPACALLGGTP